ncbi:MAG: hypothetical protein WB440_16810 [Steroidobacteraceae bacterium]|jgi:hypothetical protein
MGLLKRHARRRTAAPPAAAPPARPLHGLTEADLERRFERALEAGDGAAGALCIHETTMRGAMPLTIERSLERLWRRAAATVPDWLPMRHIERLAEIYDIALRFRAPGGRSNIYLVLLDTSDRPQPQGLYVGMSGYAPSVRFDQHKAGIRAAGSVLRRGLEVLTGPTLHLQYIQRAAAARIEIELAQALSAAGFFVRGGH